MYQITCDGLPLLDFRDNDLVLVNPKVNLEVNTVGEGSFTIYKTHPHYNSLKKLKSVFEVSDDEGVIFRGRATGDTVDFDNGMMVDMEGVMAYFNDSIVRPFSFPVDFEGDPDYIAASDSGNVISFFLEWLIDNHNDQVQDFQKMKLGNVTVTDPNNYIARSSTEYASTWEVLKSKLFDSSLGGYLCIRYEDDGNYIDYLSAFTQTNSQEIMFGENLLDLKRETEASKVCSAIIPIGALGLTLEGMEDKDITDDIVKSGDTLYSKSAVDEFGWIYAPTTETTWDDVTLESNLLNKGVNWLVNGGSFMNAMDATAVDLHFTDEQVESLRIYKNVNVKSAPHGVSESLPLEKLSIDLLNPQNTKITVGKKMMSLTEQTILIEEEAKKRYSRLSKSDEQIKLEVQDELKKLSTSFTQTLEGFTFSVENGDTSSTIKLLLGETLIDSAEIKMTGVVTFEGLADGTTIIDGGCIKTGTIAAERLDLTGAITWEDLDGNTKQIVSIAQNTANDAYSNAEQAKNIAESASTVADNASNTAINTANTVSGWCYGGTTYIDGSQIMTGTVMASNLLGGSVGLLDAYQGTAGVMSITGASTSYCAVDLTSYGALRLNATGGHVFISSGYGNSNFIWLDGANAIVGADTLIPGDGFVSYLGNINYPWQAVYSYTSTIQTSDRNLKNSIEDLPDKYLAMFDDLDPVRYKLNNGTSDRYHVGFIAQDVEHAMVSAGIVSQEFGGFVKDKDKDGNDIYMLRYEEFIGVLTAKIKQLENRISMMEGSHNE